MWKNKARSSGFKVTYSLPTDSSFTGWPTELTHLFGSETYDSEFDSIELTKDLEKIIICADVNSVAESEQDFEVIGQKTSITRIFWGKWRFILK